MMPERILATMSIRSVKAQSLQGVQKLVEAVVAIKYAI